MEKARIELQGISKSYYSETAVTQALRKINLSFYRGEFVAITGESGSGKSTLLNMIGGMDTFDEGEMYVDGLPTFQYDEEEWEEYRRTKIGYVFQDYSLIGHFSAIDNIMSALLALGYEVKRAEKAAAKYLKRVGLAGYETHRASELSSGQKQRLSIARALAKNTDILVADEPTGNLDSETGEQIIKLLRDLSKDRLVIMVTHNYDQAEPYVTRKIRIHDGQVVSDVQVNEDARSVGRVPESNDGPDEKGTNGVRADEGAKWQHKLALYLANRNRRTQKGRTFLFTAFLFIVSTVSFLLIGELCIHKDDYATRNYSTATFYREDDTRLVAKRSDGKELSGADIKEIRNMANVVAVDPCDYANDINVYLEEGTDYKYLYGDTEAKRVHFLKEDRFMMSAESITEEDLAAGRLPEKQNEIVLYGEESRLETGVKGYFAAHNIWSEGAYYQTELKVVGLLKEETAQVYFSGDLCRMLSMHIDSGVYRIYYMYDKSFGDYRMKPDLIPVVNESLSGNDVRVSAAMENPPAGTVPFHWQPYDEEGKEYGNGLSAMVNILSGGHSFTADFMEVSREFYDRYYHRLRPQASVYITSYAKTDSVIRALERRGYEAISTYRLSANDYSEEKVTERLIMIGIAVAGLIVLLVAELLILRSLMKIRMKDYFVLKFIGLKMPILRKISYYEIGSYCLAALVLTVCLMWVLRFVGIPVVEEIMWYYNGIVYAAFVLYNLCLAALTVAFFNRLLRGRLNA